MFPSSPISTGPRQATHFQSVSPMPFCAISFALPLIVEMGIRLFKTAELKASETANRNTRETCQEHINAHRVEAVRREKCKRSHLHHLIATKVLLK